MADDAIHAVVTRAQQFAERNGDDAVTTTHLLLGVMAACNTIWPRQIVNRGGMTFELALKRLHWTGLAGLADSGLRRYRVSMRLTVITTVAAGYLAVIRRLRLYVEQLPAPALDRGAADVLELAQSFNRSRPRGFDAGPGSLLLALATTPGKHLRLLDNANVLASAVRRELGLDRWHHRLIVRLDWPKLMTRRIRAWLIAGVAAHGRFSLWGGGLLLFRTAGLFSALIFFLLVVPATLFLYLFLWPALILFTGVRTAVCALLGLETLAHKWYEIPGGEIALAGPGERVPARRLAAAILLPRFTAFVCSVAAFVFVGWRSQRLGVIQFPTVFSRLDLLVGLDPNSNILTPFSFFADALNQDGVVKGIGLLAGLGAGVLSLPTYREIALVRLHAGHESGRGSRLGRVLTLPAAALTGAFACVEALLPLRNGPIYLTVYVVPLGLAVASAAAVASLLPY